MRDALVGKSVDVADAAALMIGSEVGEPCKETVLMEDRKCPPDGTFVVLG